jgi:hypothetical protein
MAQNSRVNGNSNNAKICLAEVYSSGVPMARSLVTTEPRLSAADMPELDHGFFETQQSEGI